MVLFSLDGPDGRKKKLSLTFYFYVSPSLGMISCTLADVITACQLLFCFLNRTTMKNIGLFSKSQVLNLRHALISIQLVGAEGFDHAVVMPDDVVDILTRCDAIVFWQLVVPHMA